MTADHQTKLTDESYETNRSASRVATALPRVTAGGWALFVRRTFLSVFLKQKKREMIVFNPPAEKVRTVWQEGVCSSLMLRGTTSSMDGSIVFRWYAALPIADRVACRVEHDEKGQRERILLTKHWQHDAMAWKVVSLDHWEDQGQLCWAPWFKKENFLFV